jgi:hypothetical protein
MDRAALSTKTVPTVARRTSVPPSVRIDGSVGAGWPSETNCTGPAQRRPSQRQGLLIPTACPVLRRSQALLELIPDVDPLALHWRPSDYPRHELSSERFVRPQAYDEGLGVPGPPL